MFTLNELLKATSGRLISGGKSAAAKSICTDSRTLAPGEAFIAIKGDNFDGHDFIPEAIRKKATVIVKDERPFLGKVRGAVFIAVKDTTKALGDIASFQRKKFAIPVIAVTGSNGKTTSKEMIAAVLSLRFRVLKNEGTKNNQIGLPATLFKLDESYDIAVLELGANHFGEIDYLSKICLPNIAVLTNIGPAHLEYLKDLDGVYKEKTSLIKNLVSPALVLLNADDSKFSRQIARQNNRRAVFSFAIYNKSDFRAAKVGFKNNKTEFTLRRQKFSLETLGLYNIYNALPAIGIGRIFGIEYKDIAKSLSAFHFPAGRLCARKVKGINFIDDTYNSNPLSLKCALDTLANINIKGRKVFVMGDMYELGKKTHFFHLQAGRKIAGICDIFLAVGKTARLAAKSAKACGLSVKNVFTCADTLEAKDILFNRILPHKNDIILVKGSRRMKMEELLKKF